MVKLKGRLGSGGPIELPPAGSRHQATATLEAAFPERVGGEVFTASVECSPKLGPRFVVEWGSLLPDSVESTVNGANGNLAKAGDELPPAWVRVSMVIGISLALLVGALAMFGILIQRNELVPLIIAHPAVLLEVPWSGGASLSVVLVCRSSFGEMKFKALGVEFSGASGPIAFWVLCFLCHVLAISVLWGNSGL